MMIIKCPFCGEREQSEFHYGGAAVDYPALDASIEDWHDAVFLRRNIAGVQQELWHHVHGCRMWLRVERDTTTHEILSVMPADERLSAILGVEHADLQEDAWLSDD